MRNALRLTIVGILVLVPAIAGCAHAQARGSGSFGLGRAADPADVAREDIDVAPDGTGLPLGRGDAVDGADIFAASCMSCHGTAIRLSPKRWPYATTLFDYVRRAMPPKPGRQLNANELYPIVAYELYMNGALTQHELLDQTLLPRVKMPGAGDFVQDP